MVNKESTGEKIFQVTNNIFLAILGFLTIYPIFYMLILSFNEGHDSMMGGIWLYPREFTLFNYEFVLNNPLIKDAYVVSIGRAVIGTALSIFVTAVVAYGLSFRELPYKKIIMTFIIIPMVFSGGLIPYYLQLRNLNLVDTFWVYIIPAAFNIFNMFIMKKFFMDLPESIKEAAYIDGAGHFTILVKIVLPLSIPTLAALSLFTAVGQWNDWFSGAFYVENLKLMPLQTYLQRILSADSINMLSGDNRIVQEAAARQSQMTAMTVTSVKMAAVMAGTIPILCVYPFLQKYFVKGMLIGSVKG